MERVLDDLTEVVLSPRPHSSRVGNLQNPFAYKRTSRSQPKIKKTDDPNKTHRTAAIPGRIWTEKKTDPTVRHTRDLLFGWMLMSVRPPFSPLLETFPSLRNREWSRETRKREHMKFFLSHTWVSDREGRCCHARAMKLDKALRELGHETWIDVNDMSHDVDLSMCNGIDECDAFLVLVTSSYCEKVNRGANGATDNCHKEFTYGLNSGRPCIPIAFENNLMGVLPTGVVKLYMGSRFCVDGAGEDFEKIALDVIDHSHRCSSRISTNRNGPEGRLPPLRKAPTLPLIKDAASRGRIRPRTRRSRSDVFGSYPMFCFLK